MIIQAHHQIFPFLFSFGSVCAYLFCFLVYSIYNTSLAHICSLVTFCVLFLFVFFLFSILLYPYLLGCSSRVCSCWWWIWRKFCSPRELRSRTIHIGRPNEEKYPPNEIRNQVTANQDITLSFLFLFSFQQLIICDSNWLYK